MSQTLKTSVAVIGIDIGKNSFHLVGQDRRGAIVLRQKWSRGQVEARLANLPPCLIGMEACVGAHHLSRKLQMLGHDARLMPAKYVRPYSKGQKNDFRDAEAIAAAVIVSLILPPRLPRRFPATWSSQMKNSSQVAAASAHAQTSPQSMTLAGVSDCIKEAIGAGSVESNGTALIFSCSAAKAKALYGFLGRAVRAQVVQDPNGKFENRPFGNSACYHRVADQNGKTVDDFRCDLIIVIGDALND